MRRDEGLRPTRGVPSAVVRSSCFALVAIAVAVLLARFGPAMADPHDVGDPVPGRAVLYVLLGAVWMLVATIEWVRGHQRTGAELLAVAGVIAVGALITVRLPPVYTIGSMVLPLLGAPLGTYVILRYPEVALRRWSDRLPIVLAAIGGATTIPVHLLYTPHLYGCPTCPPDLNAVYQGSDDRVLAAVMILGGVAIVASLVSLTIVIGRRYLTAGPVARRIVGPVTAAVLVYVAGTVLYVIDQNALLSELLPMQATRGAGGAAFLIAATAAPLGLLFARGRERSLMGRLSELAVPMEGAALEMALQRLVGDPDLRVGRSTPEGGLRSADGTPLALPAAEDTARTVTSLGEGIGVLVHDPVLVRERSMLDALTVVAALAVRNQQLAEEVTARLVEVRASRERLVRAADDARRRIERDLHDGAQQRLVTVALRVRMMQAQMRAGDGGGVDAESVAAELEVVSLELQESLRELRALARGMFPTSLSNGLRPALEVLASTAAVPVSLAVALDRRLPDVIETGAYFVVAEALTNVGKHAGVPARVELSDRGDHLWIVVQDDGPGGADPSGGGLAGLGDRVAALGGTVAVRSALGKGTTVTATFPVTASRTAPDACGERVASVGDSPHVEPHHP